MSEINKQNQVPSANPSDLIPVYSNTYGVTQQMAVSQLIAYIQAQGDVSSGITQQYASPSATGFTVNIENSLNGWLILTPLAGFATGTLSLPSTPVNLQQLTVSCTQSVSTLTVNGNGKSVVGAPSALSAGDTFTLRYDSINSTWYGV